MKIARTILLGAFCYLFSIKTCYAVSSTIYGGISIFGYVDPLLLAVAPFFGGFFLVLGFYLKNIMGGIKNRSIRSLIFFATELVGLILAAPSANTLLNLQIPDRSGYVISGLEMVQITGLISGALFIGLLWSAIDAARNWYRSKD